MSEKSVLLLSDKSSGSTIFQYELLRHPSLTATRFTPHNDHETLFWVKAAMVLNKPRELFYGGKFPFSRSFAERSIRELIRKNAPDYKIPQDITQLEYCGWKTLIDAHKPVFFEKSPHHLNHTASTLLILNYALNHPETRVIGLVRDPRSVIYSTLKRWYVNPLERQYKWLSSYQNLLLVESLIPKEQYLRVRYEDLISDPEAGFSKVVSFLGLEPERAIGQGMHDRSLQKWKIDQGFEVPLDKEVVMVARHFGYEVEAGRVDSAVFEINPFKKFLFERRSQLQRFYKQHFQV